MERPTQQRVVPSGKIYRQMFDAEVCIVVFMKYDLESRMGCSIQPMYLCRP